MSWDNIGDYILNAYTITLTALVGAIGFLVRKIFTSEKKIELLEQSLSHFEEEIKELRADVKQLIFRDR